MAQRNVYRNPFGNYFKAEGFNWYLPSKAGLREGDKVEVTSVSIGCSNTGLAGYIDAKGKKCWVRSESRI